jgi:hypothetical protein
MSESEAGRNHIRLQGADNVTTLLDSHVDRTRLAGGGPVDAGIPFGHKAAVAAIARGEPVRKYGVVIGHATRTIRPGEHVHVHNCS